MGESHRVRQILGAGAAAFAGVAAWTQVERCSPVVRDYRISVPLPPELDEFTILHLSDLHLFPGQEWMIDFIHRLTQLDFDLVVSTGDNFGSIRGLDLIRRAYAPLLEWPGVFVLGSNDYYSPRPKRWDSYLWGSHTRGRRTIPDLPWLDLVRDFADAGWVDLSNQAEVVPVDTLPEGVRLACVCVDDPHINRDRVPEVPVTWERESTLRLGVTHAPYQRILNEFTALRSHLILAGHTHGGQLCLPGVGALVTNCDLPRGFASGVFDWSFSGEHSAVHVSAGLGTSPYAPVRFFCRPEVSLIHLVNEPQ